MKRTIYNFRKTDHFLHRQWHRGIEDNLLENLLADLPPQPKNTKTVLIVLKSHLEYLKKKQKYYVHSKGHLVIICKANVLITVFFVDILNDFYLFSQFKQYEKILLKLKCN